MNNHLHQLVHSLSQGERLHFSRYHLNTKEGGKSSMLFKGLLKQSKYNPEKLHHLFKNKSEYAFYKNYLKEQLLDSLLYRSKDNTELAIMQFVEQAAILRRRGLYHEAGARLKKAKKIAMDKEDNRMLSKVVSAERQLLRSEKVAKDFQPEIIALYEEESEYLQNMEIENELAKLNFTFVHSYRDSLRARDKEKQEQFLEWMRHPLLSHPEKITTFNAKANYYNMLSTAAFYMRNYDDFAKHALALANIYRERKVRGFDVHRQLLATLYNACRSLTFLNRKETEFDLILAEIGEYRHDSQRPDLQSASYQYQALAVLQYKVHHRKIGSIARILPKFQSEFEEHQNMINETNQMYLMRLFASCHFYLGNIDNSQSLNHQFLQTFGHRKNHRLYLITSICHLLDHYELGNQQLLWHAIRNVYRMLLKREAPLRFENTLMASLKKLIRVGDASTIKDLLRELRDTLLKLGEVPLEEALEDFAYIDWLTSKIEGKRMQVIMESK